MSLKIIFLEANNRHRQRSDQVGEKWATVECDVVEDGAVEDGAVEDATEDVDAEWDKKNFRISYQN